MAPANARGTDEVEDAIRGDDFDTIQGAVRLVRALVPETCDTHAWQRAGLYTRRLVNDDTTFETTYTFVGRAGRHPWCIDDRSSDC